MSSVWSNAVRLLVLIMAVVLLIVVPLSLTTTKRTLKAVAAPTPTPAPEYLSCVRFSGSDFEPASGPEWIEVTSYCGEDAEVTDWTITDREGNRFAFGPQVLKPCDAVLLDSDTWRTVWEPADVATLTDWNGTEVGTWSEARGDTAEPCR